MRDLFRINLRRDLITAGVLLAFATMAMAAAQWGTFSPGEPATLTGERDVAFMGDVDHSLPSSAALPRVPMFTTGGSPIADGAVPADPVLPPAPYVAAASVASSNGGFGTWSSIGTSWHSAGGFGSGDGSPFLRGASSASGIGSIAGIGGGGAWGGVSGSSGSPAAKSNQTVVAGASSKVVTKASNPARALSATPGTAASLVATSAPAFFGNAGGPVAQALAPQAAAFQHDSGPPLADPAPAAHHPGPATPHDSPSSAPTPEPLSFILVGVGLAGIYAVRKHLR